MNTRVVAKIPGVVTHSTGDDVWYTIEIDGKPVLDTAQQPRRFMTCYAAIRALDMVKAKITRKRKR